MTGRGKERPADSFAAVRSASHPTEGLRMPVGIDSAHFRTRRWGWTRAGGADAVRRPQWLVFPAFAVSVGVQRLAEASEWACQPLNGRHMSPETACCSGRGREPSGCLPGSLIEWLVGLESRRQHDGRRKTPDGSFARQSVVSNCRTSLSPAWTLLAAL